MKLGTGRSLSILLAVSLTGLLLRTQDAAGGLYQCRTNDGLIYTDAPAQLTQCTPLTPGGGTSPLGLVGGHTSGSSSLPPSAPVPPQPQPAIPQTPELSPTPVPSPASHEAATPPPCPTGINPLNPLSALPCPTTDAPPPAAPVVPTDPNTPPPPAQP